MIRQITLWDIMNQFDLSSLLQIAYILGRIEATDRILKSAPPYMQQADDVISDSYKRSSIGSLQTFQKECTLLGMPMSSMSAQKLIDKLSEHGITHHKVAKLFEELDGRLVDETRLMVFYSIKPSRQDLLNTENPFGNSVAEAFPSAAEDIKYAGRCLAYECWTASVMHSMRVLEVGLNALASRMGVPFEYRNWETVIDKIESAIKNKRYADKTEEQFDSEAAVQFRYLKNAWRNHVMHVRNITYDEERATEIFGHIKEFMVHLSTRLKE